MVRYTASWIVPVSGRPLRNGTVLVESGRIVAVEPGPPPASRTVDLGAVAVLPGLVNAHTHLELSHLRGQVHPAPAFVTWIRSIMTARARPANQGPADILAGIHAGIAEALASGTAVVGDISNTLETFGPLVGSELVGRLFYELIGFSAPDPADRVAQACHRLDALEPNERVRPALAAHAPYSVSPAMLEAIATRARSSRLAPWSVHLSEGAEETEFIRTGTGPWRVLLEELGAWDSGWVAPGVSPVEYLDRARLLDSSALVVHGVQMSERDLALLEQRGATLVTCPRSNVYTGAGAPPIEAFYQSGVRVAVGTDSLASTPDLNLFAELQAMRRLAPSIAAASLLESATIQGARALGFDAGYGTIETGKLARLLAVDVPGGVTDVEEYLVSGIRPEQVRWVQ